MINSNIYVPPHRRCTQQNVYVPPHRRDGRSSDFNSCNEKSSVNFENTNNFLCQRNSDTRHNFSHSSPSNSIENIVNALATINIDDSKSPQIDCSKYCHILEISGFSLKETSFDIEKIFKDYSKFGFLLKWVDDGHCLIVFSSSEIANQALSDKILRKTFILNSIDNFSRSSKWKILKSPGDWAMPYKCRPPVLLNPSRRMIYHSLGLKSQITDLEKEIEKKKIEAFKSNHQ